MMDIQRLKEYILENDSVKVILESLGCHHIKNHSGTSPYITCGNPDGDNPSAITVYQNEYLTTIDYTRNLKNSKADIFSLVEFFKNCSFFEAVKEICDWIDLDYYHDFDEDLPESLRISKMILDMQNGIATDDEDVKTIQPISERILTYYENAVNDMFLNDGIDYETQRLFEVGYDDFSNRITIPIRDELGTLVGIKGRAFKKELGNELKYIYLEPCARNQILYGLNHTYPAIKREGSCFVGEAEKSCMQLWSMGICNSVAIGGKKISSCQIDKLTRLCTDIIFLFDKDVTEEEMKMIGERFLSTTNVYAVIDKIGILDEKESPTDNPEKFQRLIKECKYKIN